jgi:hypothetical protein
MMTQLTSILTFYPSDRLTTRSDLGLNRSNEVSLSRPPQPRVLAACQFPDLSFVAEGEWKAQ